MYNLRLKIEEIFNKKVEIVEFNKIIEKEVEKVIFEAIQKVKSEGDARSCERIMEDAKKLTRGEIAIGCGQRYSLVIEQI